MDKLTESTPEYINGTNHYYIFVYERKDKMYLKEDILTLTKSEIYPNMHEIEETTFGEKMNEKSSNLQHLMITTFMLKIQSLERLVRKENQNRDGRLVRVIH